MTKPEHEAEQRSDVARIHASRSRCEASAKPMTTQIEKGEGVGVANIVGCNVLTQEEVDKLVARCAELQDIESANVDLQNALAAKDAEITGLYASLKAAAAANEAWRLKCEGMSDKVHGIEAPRKLDDLPKLGDIPPHS